MLIWFVFSFFLSNFCLKFIVSILNVSSGIQIWHMENFFAILLHLLQKMLLSYFVDFGGEGKTGKGEGAAEVVAHAQLGKIKTQYRYK